jgi:hypothetical protein
MGIAIWGSNIAIAAFYCIGVTLFDILWLVTMAHWRCADRSNVILFGGSFRTILRDLHYAYGSGKHPNYAIKPGALHLPDLTVLRGLSYSALEGINGQRRGGKITGQTLGLSTFLCVTLRGGFCSLLLRSFTLTSLALLHLGWFCIACGLCRQLHVACL